MLTDRTHYQRRLVCSQQQCTLLHIPAKIALVCNKNGCILMWGFCTAGLFCNMFSGQLGLQLVIPVTYGMKIGVKNIA